MKYCIHPGTRSGTVTVPSSKSLSHRLLIACALSEKENTLIINGISDDISTTVSCLRSLGYNIEQTGRNTIHVSKSKFGFGKSCWINCNDSAATLRLLLPIAAAKGLCATFHMSDALSKRPMDDLISVLKSHKIRVSRWNNLLVIRGKLTPGNFSIPGNITSQYVSGLLYALPLLSGTSTLRITGKAESSPYILMTEKVLKQSGIVFEKKGGRYIIPGNQKYSLCDTFHVEPDWSNAAFFLCMGALSEKGITVKGLNPDSVQGDREILKILTDFGAEVHFDRSGITVRREKLTGQTVDASEIPDVVPAISALALCAEGTTRIVNASRLRFKESDRLKTTAEMLSSLGGDIENFRDGLVILGKPLLNGGTVNSANDHRIAMSAAVAACVCRNRVFINGAECVSKSFPSFWECFESLDVTR